MKCFCGLRIKSTKQGIFKEVELLVSLTLFPPPLLHWCSILKNYQLIFHLLCEQGCVCIYMYPFFRWTTLYTLTSYLFYLVMNCNGEIVCRDRPHPFWSCILSHCMDMRSLLSKFSVVGYLGCGKLFIYFLI